MHRKSISFVKFQPRGSTSSVRQAIRAFVENRSQFEVCEAVNGNEALQKAAGLNPDLIV
jgi:DNA-binding NarL/FixJ family response regulator